MRKNLRFEILLALVLVALFAAFSIWQNPGSRLAREDVDAYLRVIEPRLPLTGAEKAETLARLRAWGEADDGRPVQMLNAMRYYDKLQPVPGFEGGHRTPAEANAYYESAVFPILVRVGGYPLAAGNTAGVTGGDGRRHSNLMFFDREVDDWDRVLTIRYPSRRAFFDLLSNPDYAPLIPYKLASLRVALVPVDGEASVPDARWPVGLALLSIFLAVGWFRAAARRR